MANIDLSSVLFYKGGKSGVSRVVGNDYENGGVISRVARYTITAPPEGASSISLEFQANQFGDGSYIDLRFYIGTDPDSHADAGKNSEYTGVFTIEKTKMRFTAEADILLIPGQTYYLWLFPAVDTYGWYYWQNASMSSMETAGSAGLIHLDSGTSVDGFLLCIDNGSDWDTFMPQIDNGSIWDLFS